MMDFHLARQNMIEQQIRTWEVLDPTVLAQLSEIHREDFIPDEYKNLALSDCRIPLGHDQTTMTPKTEARILQSVKVKSDDSILEIGTGCGYLTALLAGSGKHVTTLEYYKDLSEAAGNILTSQGFDNITLQHTDVFDSMPGPESHDVIIITTSMPKQNPIFAHALRPGGRLFQIIGQSPVMEALLLTRNDENAWHKESLFETDIPPLIGSDEPTAFQL